MTEQQSRVRLDDGSSRTRPEDLPLLKINSKNPMVAFLRHLLTKPTPTKLFNLMDYAKTPPIFDKELEEDVKYFQSTHLGRDGFFLDDDGIVGENTWWALLNPSGSSQRSFIELTLPKWVTQNKNTFRYSLLETALKEYNHNVFEVPDNSNRGERIDIYTGGRPVPWCMKFVSFVIRQAIINRERLQFKPLIPWDSYEGSTYRCYTEAKRFDKQNPAAPKMFYENNFNSEERSILPMAGDLFMIQYGNGKGHVGIVARVEYKTIKTKSGNDKIVVNRFNTIEGNAGNRIKIGLREVSKEKNLVGFINVCAGEVVPEYDMTSIIKESSVIEPKQIIDERTR